MPDGAVGPGNGEGPVADLRAAAAEFGRLADEVAADQWAAPTPCTAWSVGELVDHVVLGNRLFAAALRGGDSPTSGAATPDPESRRRDIRESADAVVAAFAEPGALERPITVPFGTVPGAVALNLRLTEFLVHGWDLARACGGHVAADAAVVERVIGFTTGALSQIPPERSPFGSPTQAPAGADALDRLAALLGRDVSATS